MGSMLIISDSHGWTEELAEIRKRHYKADDAIHCGDSELRKDDNSLSDYRTVNGNCDLHGSFPNEIVFELDGLTFLVTHGHLFDIKGSLMKLEYRAEEIGADIVCFGHSHVAYAEKIRGRLFINPGSIRLPRQFQQGSYVMLDWNHPHSIHLRFLDRNGKEISDFPYPNQFSLK